MPERLTFITDEELYVHACVLRGMPATPRQRDQIATARAQANFLGYALRELGRDGKKNEPKRLTWSQIKPLIGVPKEPVHA